MRLLAGFFGAKASTNWVQIGHRSTAIDYARDGIKLQHKANVKAFFRRDKIFSQFEVAMQNWVVETLYQGAYLREYHLWEKDCKAYFATMAARNQTTWATKPRSGVPFTTHVKDTLEIYNVLLPDTVFNAIEVMRQRVNVMKHDSGLELDHFITEAEYKEAIGAVEEFWEFLTTQERYNPNVE